MALQPNEQLYLDALQDQTGFIPFFKSLPQKPSTTVRLFNRTEYYTVHGDDALFTAKEVYKTTAVVKYFGSEPNRLASVILNKANFEFWVRELLLVRQYRVEIYQNRATNNKVKNDWFLKEKASPGNLGKFEERFFASGDNTNLVGIMAVKLSVDVGQKVVGVAYVDAASRNIWVSEFADNDFFTNLEAMIVQLGPSECLLPSSDQNSDYAKIKQVLDRSKMLISDIKKGDFQTKDVVQDLNRLLRLDNGMENCFHLKEVNMINSMSALAALITFLKLLNEEAGLGHYKLRTFDSTQFLRLDSSAVDALQINPSAQDTNKFQNLLGVFNSCRTGQGQRLLSQWMKQPLLDFNRIEERQNIVGSFVDDTRLRQLLHEDYLRKLPDFQKLAKRFMKKKANLQDCYRLYQALSTLPQLNEELDKMTGEHFHLIKANYYNKLQELMIDFSKFEQLVEHTIDLSLVHVNEFVIKAEFDAGLTVLRERVDGLQEHMKGLLGKAAKELGFEAGKAIKLDSNEQLGFFFRVTLKEEKALRGNRNFTMIDANKTGVRFHSTALRQANEEYLGAREEYKLKQRAIVNEIMDITAGYIEPMQQLSEVVAELDAVISLAVTATAAPTPYVKPKILPKGSGIIELVQARHPCMELQEQITYISNNAHFDNDKRFQIITGPNMGGKSTYMRTVGLVVLLAQIGSYVPCESATVSIVDAILTRVGCEDSHTRAMSTFMLEMVEMASILRVATENSLLIIDELGRGTSTYDGFGLAWAIAEKISKELKSYCMFATHFHELTLLEDEVPSVTNLHVAAIVGNEGPTFLYRVKAGVCDRSYGLHVAELVQFPEKVLEFAREKARELEDFQSASMATYNPEFSGENEAAVKKRQQAKKEGEKIIAEFLGQVKRLDTDKLNEHQLRQEVEKLKMEVAAKNNPYVQSILRKQ